MGIWTRRGLPFRYRYRRKRKKKYNIYLLMIVFVLLVFYSFSVFDKRIMPTLSSIAENRAKYMATRAINEAVNEKIAQENVDYADLITFQKGNEGQITALQANIVRMNQLKSAISMSVQQKIVNINTTQIDVPIGNVLNIQVLSGWGPRIPVRLIPVGSAEADFKNSFETAGINQTKHEIALEIRSNIIVLLPAARVSSSVTTTVPVAETIIVGNVPDSYINIEGTTGNPADTTLDFIQY